jgi:hypothetical protein
MLFSTFARCGSVSATIKHFRQAGLLFPTRLAVGTRKGELLWAPLSLSRAARALHNPAYAGAYTYGRSRWHKAPDGRGRLQPLPRDEWFALIKDAHPASISWDEHERIENQLQHSARALCWQRQIAPREGPALLQGRVVCGLCGSRMHVHYNVRASGKLVPSYTCLGRGRSFGDPPCQSICGEQIDTAVGELLVDTVTPSALQLALAVQQEIAARFEEADRLRYRQVERAQYEADMARHRSMQVDPAHRLVAESLEAEWNQKLRALGAAQQEYERQRAARTLGIDAEQRQRVLSLATDFPAIWRDPRTAPRQRKRMLGLLVDDVTLIKQRQVTVAVRFRGGATTTLALPRPLTAQQLRATHDDVRQQIDALLDEYTDAQVAHMLNERASRTGAGDAFDGVSVQWVRFAHKLKSLKQRLLDGGWLTSQQMSLRLGVARTTLGRLRRTGRIKARICNDHGEWLYWPPSPEDTCATSTTDSSTARGAV